MTAEELAARHPRLFHITLPQAVPGILRHGLLPVSRLFDLFEIPAEERYHLERRRRAQSLTLRHPVHGEAVITDNQPLSELALANCLEDGLSAADWMLMLNARVFFWPDEARTRHHLNARCYRGREMAVLRFDTLKLANACLPRIELTPINTGSTIRRPARRGLATFTPASAVGYQEWRRLRGGCDSVKEICVAGGVRDVARFLLPP